MSKVRCAFCDNRIEKDEALNNGIQNFCNQEHLVGYRNRLNKKQKKNRTPFPEGLWERIMVLDGGRCRFCGTTYDLHVHHIVYRSSGGPHTEGNLIVLCRKHHEIVHSNKRLYQPLCEELAGLRSEKGDKTTLIPQLGRNKIWPALSNE